MAAALEGGITFAVKVLEKRKSGTKIQDFTWEDWKDVGFDTLAGTRKGAIRGVTVYAMTNYTPVPSPLASAMVTATFGAVAQARKLQDGMISEEDFVDNCEVICLEVAVSALSSILGEVLIPVPVLGTIIGNATGMFMYEISKSYLSATEEKLISEYRQECEKHIQQFEVEYQTLSVLQTLSNVSLLIIVTLLNVNINIIVTVPVFYFFVFKRSQILFTDYQTLIVNDCLISRSRTWDIARVYTIFFELQHNICIYIVVPNTQICKNSEIGQEQRYTFQITKIKRN